MIQIVPAIDIIGGKCVRLTRGDYASVKTYDASPVDAARRYADAGVRRIHLVDLDGAKASEPRNLETLSAIAAAVPCELEWGGGIASSDDLSAVFDAGATHAIIGSVAALQPELFASWLAAWGPRMILGADVRLAAKSGVAANGRVTASRRGASPHISCEEGGGCPPAATEASLADWRVAVKGWQEDAPLSLEDLLKRFSTTDGALREAIVTDIGRDGMLQGPTTGLYVRLQAAFPQITFTVSGGVSSMDDIRALDAAGARKAIVGKALYENRISLEDIALWSQKG